MKSRKFFAFTLVALTIAGGLGLANAQGGGSPAASAGGGEQGDPRMADPLALYKMAGINADQEAQIRKLAKDFEDAQRVRVQTVFGLMRELKLLQLQPDPPEAEALAKQEEVNKLTGELATERLKLLLKVRKVLTPDQRKKLVALLSDDGGKGEGSDGGAAAGGK